MEIEKPSSLKERKLVPRFRRKVNEKNFVDADDQEAQELIDKDLRSNFIWKSDTTNEQVKQQLDNYQNESNHQQIISLDDHSNQQCLYDIHDDQEQLWKSNIQLDNNEQSNQWKNYQENKEISLNLNTNDHQEQRWSLNNQHSEQINQFHLNDHQNHSNQFDIHSNENHSKQNFLQGEQFLNQMTFALPCDYDQFPLHTEDIQTISFDSNLPIQNSSLSLPQPPIILHWLEGISEYTLSLPGEQLSKIYSPFHSNEIQLDSNHLKALQWSLDLLKENLLLSYLLSLPNQEHDQLSIPEQYHLILSLEDEYSSQEQFFSSKDCCLFEQTISYSSNDLKEQLLSIIDSIQIKQNFGYDQPTLSRQWSLDDLKISLQNISPQEILHLLYSPQDVQPISFQQLLIDSDEVSARAFRRYRCKHMSIKMDEKDQLDSSQLNNLQFQGNEQIAIGEEQIENDFTDEQIYRDVTNCEILLKDILPQCYDIKTSDSSRNYLGPCLFRRDYEREPPKIWSRLRQEIGHLSYNASFAQPIYHLDKSFKRFVHIPKERTQCSYNVYRGYEQFQDKARLNPDNYYRPHDGTDLRPLLSWYSQKQYLFSSTNPILLKPPKFLCRRLVLRTILANLYCDSEPWKLLVVRIKGQFYLSLANKATKHVETMTEDEYSGMKFEQLFTTNQPNTTRFQEEILLENPQEQFHTVQYWTFGDFNLLYSNEIDGEITEEMIPKTQTDQTTKQDDNSIKVTLTDNIDKSVEPDECETEQVIEDESKVAQINENLQLINNDENEEKSKHTENTIKTGYVEMKCTRKKIFYRDENKLHTLHWWAQMWLANVSTLMIGYKTSHDGNLNQIEFYSIEKLISRFLSRYNLHLKYCLSYLYSFLHLIEQTILIDDPNTIHAFAYIPQPLDIDPLTGQTIEVDLPQCVPFRYTQMKRSNQRHANFIPEWYIQDSQRTIPFRIFQDEQIQMKTVEQEMKKRAGHRGRTSSVLKQQSKSQQKHRKKNSSSCKSIV